MAILLIFFGVHVVEAGALRGLGLQSHATLTVLISQYAFAIPFGYLFAITLKQGV